MHSLQIPKFNSVKFSPYQTKSVYNYIDILRQQPWPDIVTVYF